jgi:hypothetical protein
VGKVFNFFNIKKPSDFPDGNVCLILLTFYVKNVYYLYYVSKGLGQSLGWNETAIFVSLAGLALPASIIPFVFIITSIFIDLIGILTMIFGLNLPVHLAVFPLVIYLAIAIFALLPRNNN